jgi:hypothetical protein
MNRHREAVPGRLQNCHDPIRVAADWAILDVFLLLAAADVRIGIYEGPAVGALVLASHRQHMVLVSKSRQAQATPNWQDH